MGDLNVKLVSTQKQLNNFTKNLLRDVQALETMLEDGWFDDSPAHIGAEQEICLVDKHFKPAPIAMDVLDKLKNDNFTTELARFNVEANLTPRLFKGNCFSLLEKEIVDLLGELNKITESLNHEFVLTGILPTIRKFDLNLENLTPLQRYDALIKAINKLRGKVYELRIGGIDELNVKHDSAMLEACNTSFQVHLQVTPEEFVDKYNIAQVLTAPVMALASNSPMLFGKRLWRETRIALFQQSVDTRITSEHLRDRSPRVTFGNDWLKNSIVDLYKEDIVRFRVMLMTDVQKDVLEEIAEGVTPKLNALMIHNSTVYRWNRPCYGISKNGKPHLRIENRIFPAGPSVIDEVANSAFWLGLMEGFSDECKDVTKMMSFSDAKSNFISAARSGMETELTWLKNKKVSVTELVKKELLPLAKEGLKKKQVSKGDIDRLMEVIEERNETRRNGSTWILESYAKLRDSVPKEERTIAITSSMLKNQKTGKPVHQWKLANSKDLAEWHPTSLLVEEFMTTDLFTVYKDDIPELVSDVMDWQKIRYIPIEDEKGRLVGLITSRILLRYFTQKCKLSLEDSKTVKDLMIKDPYTISPEATINEANDLMNDKKIGCLPVVKNDKLVGIITEGNFLSITESLLAMINRREQRVKKKRSKLTKKVINK